MEGWGDAGGSWQQGPCHRGAGMGGSFSGRILGGNGVRGCYGIVLSAVPTAVQEGG